MDLGWFQPSDDLGLELQIVAHRSAVFSRYFPRSAIAICKIMVDPYFRPQSSCESYDYKWSG